MEANGSVLIDQAVYMKRNSASIPVFSNTCSYNTNNNGFLGRSGSQQIYSCHGAMFPGARPSLYAPGPFPAATYQSLPPPHLLQQTCPPLLPLPLSRSFSLPSPSTPLSTRRLAGATTVRPANKDQKKARPSPAKLGGSRPHKEPPAAASGPGRAPKSAVPIPCPLTEEAASDGGDFTGDVYSLSPPPSSLPMPSFSLRPRTPSSSSSSSSCNSEVLGKVVLGDSGVDAGASDELRQLLRL